MCYNLLGRLNGNDPERGIYSDDIAPCHIIIKNGVMTTITCPNIMIDDTENYGQTQADTLYTILKMLLPRTDARLYTNSDDVIEEDIKGNVHSSRTYDEDGNVLSKYYDLDCFDNWDVDVAPEAMSHSESVLLSDDTNHVQSSNLNEPLFTTPNMFGWVIDGELSGTIGISCLWQYTGSLQKTFLFNPEGALIFKTSNFSVVFSKIEFFRKFCGSRKTRGKLIQNIISLKNKCSIAFLSFLMTSLQETIPMLCFYCTEIGGATLSLVYANSFPNGPHMLTALGEAAPDPVAMFDVFCCYREYKVNLGDCDTLQETAQTRLVACLTAPAPITAALVQNDFDTNIMGFLNDFVLEKMQYCIIDCPAGGGITGEATFDVFATFQNTLSWGVFSYDIPLDESSEFFQRIDVTLFSFPIPIIPGIASLTIEFGLWIEYGMNYEEFNDGNDYIEQSRPFVRAGALISGDFGFNVGIASAQISADFQFTFVDYELVMEFALVGIISNPSLFLSLFPATFVIHNSQLGWNFV